MDTKIGARADVLQNGTELFVVVYEGGTAGTVILSTYSYTPQTYSLVGAPVSQGLGSGLETVVTIAKENNSTKLWIAYEVGTNIYARSSPDWLPPSTPLSTASVKNEDIAAVVAFADKIGVLWSDHIADRFLFRVHENGQPDENWGAAETVAQGG